MVSEKNPLGLQGIDFVEFSSPDPGNLDEIFTALGFSLLKQHNDKSIDYYRQNDIHFFVNREDEGFAADFRDEHGPSICSMGFRVEDASAAFDTAVSRGAKPVEDDVAKDLDLPAIWGIGDSLVYFVDQWGEKDSFIGERFDEHDHPTDVESKGFRSIDHLTNNVYQGTKQKWADFYKDVFGFREIRFFDIKGKKTGLTSYALASPCGTFSLPINESSDEKSQIEEYLNDYNGPGIQHLALATHDLLDSLDAMEGGPIDDARHRLGILRGGLRPCAECRRRPRPYRAPRRARRRRRRRLPAADLYEEYHRADLLRAHPAQESQVVWRRQFPGAVRVDRA